MSCSTFICLTQYESRRVCYREDSRVRNTLEMHIYHKFLYRLFASHLGLVDLFVLLPNYILPQEADTVCCSILHRMLSFWNESEQGVLWVCETQSPIAQPGKQIVVKRVF